MANEVPSVDTPITLKYTQLHMFGISGEHLLILGIILLFFGPKRLPQVGHTLGKAIRNFKDSLSGLEEAQYRKLSKDDEPKPDTPSKDVAKEEVPGDKKDESKPS